MGQSSFPAPSNDQPEKSSQPEPDEIQAALERLDESRCFERSESQLRLLRFLLENAGDSPEGLKEAYIGRIFFGRTAAYDPRYDSIVRVNVKRLRERLSEYYEDEGQQDPIRFEIQRGSYIPLVTSVPRVLSAIETQLFQEGHALAQASVQKWKLRTAIISVVLLVPAGSAWTYMFYREHRLQAVNITAPRVLLSSGASRDADPEVSPDGSQLVYVTGVAGQHYRLALRPFQMDAEPAKLLDTGPGEATHPEWSPDGKQIAFQRCISGPCEIDVITLAGGKVRRIASPNISFFDEEQFYLSESRRAIWTVDGKALLFPARTASGESQIVRHDLSTDAEQVLLRDKPPYSSSNFALAKDGHTLAFTHHTETGSEIQTLDLNTLQRSTVISPWPIGTNGLTWWPDGRSILVSTNFFNGQGFELWRISLHGKAVRVIVPVSLPMMPRFTPNGKALLMLSVNQNKDFVVLDGRQPEKAPWTLVHALQNNAMADVSPDGHTLAVLQFDNHSGGYELFTAKLDKGEIGELKQLTHGMTAIHCYSVQWSPDGRWVVVGQALSGSGVLIVDALTGQHSKLSTPGLEKYDMAEPVWSADSQSLYVPGRGNMSGIYAVSTGPVPGVKLLLTCDPLDLRVDGDRTLYFEQSWLDGIYRLPLHGEAKAELVPQLANVRVANDWTIVNGGLYFMDLKNPDRKFQRLDLKTGALTVVVPDVPHPAFNRGWITYMPAQHKLLYTQWAENAMSQIVGFSLE